MKLKFYWFGFLVSLQKDLKSKTLASHELEYDRKELKVKHMEKILSFQTVWF